MKGALLHSCLFHLDVVRIMVNQARACPVELCVVPAGLCVVPVGLSCLLIPHPNPVSLQMRRDIQIHLLPASTHSKTSAPPHLLLAVPAGEPSGAKLSPGLSLSHTTPHAQNWRGSGTYRGALADEATASVAGNCTGPTVPAGFAFTAVHHGVTASACEGEEHVRGRGRCAKCWECLGAVGTGAGSCGGCGAHPRSQVGTRICSR